MKTLVELHKGRIDVRSDGSGAGTEFTVHLPVIQDEAAPVRDRDDESAHQSSEARRRVLVVDDNVDSAEMLFELLTAKRHDVRTAHSGADALTIVRDFTPEVVLLDIGLPGMNGYDVARQIRQSDSGQQIFLVALTGFGQPADRERTAEAGFDAHVVKPVDPDAISLLVTTGHV